MSSTNQPPSIDVSLSQPPLNDTIQSKDASGDIIKSSSKHEVVIVGAGMAGLAAAYHILLKRPSTKLTILESKERVGGRIHSMPVEGGTIDLGASFIHGVQGNPIFALANKLNLPYKRTMTALRVIRADGSVISPELTARVAPRIFGTVFGWLIEEAQGGESVPNESESIKDRIFAEDSPIYHDPEEEKDLANSPGNAETQASIVAANKGEDEERKEIIRISELIIRGFQGWTGAPLDYVSLKWWGFGQDTEGGDAVLTGGYGPLVDWLVGEIKRMGGQINVGERVGAVSVDEEEGVTLKISGETKGNENPAGETKGKEYQTPFALMTLPLGVLKQNPPSFEPPLPYRRMAAIKRMGMGLLDKVVLIYENAWWAEGEAFVREDENAMAHILLPDENDPTRLLGPSKGVYPPSSDLPGAFPPRTLDYLEKNGHSAMLYDMHAQNGIPALCIFVPGEFGDVMECCSEEETIEWANGIVKDWLAKASKNSSVEGGANAKVPDPIKVVRTNWRKDPDSRGSYAYIPIGVDGKESASPNDQLELGRTLWDRVFWAGEHTEVNQFASVHGAWTSGVREADKILIGLENQEEE